MTKMQRRTPLRLAEAMMRAKHRDISTLRYEIGRGRESVRKAMSDARQMMLVAKSQRERVVERRRALAERRRAYAAEVPALQREARNAYKNMLAHKVVERISVARDGKVSVYTPLLFCKIREGAGIRRSKRACIGAYKITLDPSCYGISVRQMLFERHWAINGTSPCMGEYQDEVVRRFDRGDMYGIVDIMYQWLIGADNDGGAYMRSHEWRDQHRNRIAGTASAAPPRTYSREEHVIFTEKQVDGRFLQGRTGIISSCNQSVATVQWRPHPADKNGREWTVQTSQLLPITKAQYEAAVMYEIKNPARSVLEKIDALADGTSLKQALSLAREIATNQLVIGRQLFVAPVVEPKVAEAESAYEDPFEPVEDEQLAGTQV